MAANVPTGSTPAVSLRSVNGRNRRILPASARPGEGHLAEPITDVQPARREPLFMPAPQRPLLGRPEQRRGRVVVATPAVVQGSVDWDPRYEGPLGTRQTRVG